MTVTGDAGATRHQQRVEELCGAAVRALTGQADLHFRARRLYRGSRLLTIAAPHLYPEPEADFGSFRGAADGLALRLLHSDAALHAAHAPPQAAARAVFDLLEQLRVESLVAAAWRGARHNLAAPLRAVVGRVCRVRPDRDLQRHAALCPGANGAQPADR